MNRLFVASSLGMGYGVSDGFVAGISSPLFPSIVLRHENCFNELVQFIQVDITQNGATHASYNVAKKVVEFEYQEEIPRHRLRAAYGDGFKGAPLRCQVSGEGLLPQDAATCDGTATQALSSLPQEDNSLGGSCHV